MQSGNACSSFTTQQCLSVISQPIPPTIKPPLIICNDDAPFTWDEDPFPIFFSVGTFTVNSTPYESHSGCDSIIRQTITIKPPLFTSLPTKYLCAGECFELAGDTYCDPGPQSIYLDSYQGCDSLINFAIQLLTPIAQIVGDSTLSCENQGGVTLSATNFYGGSTFQWTDANWAILSGAPTNNITQAGIYHLVVTATGGGTVCRDTAMVTVTAVPTLLDVQATGGILGCDIDSLMLNCLVSSNDAQFLWAGPGGFISVLQNPVVTEPGVYTVSVSNPLGCMGTATSTVTNGGNLPVAIAYGDTLSCVSPTAMLTGITNTPGATVSWSGPGNFQSTDLNPVVNQPGAYLLTVTTAGGGCTNTATAYVLGQTNALTPAPYNGYFGCSPTATLICGSDALQPQYHWIGPNNFSSAQAQPLTPTPGVYSVTITDIVTLCSAVASVTVSENRDVPVIETIQVANPSNGQNNGHIDIAVSGAPGPNTYVWYYNGPIFAHTEDLSNLAPGFYNCVVTAANGCTAVQTFELHNTSATSEHTDISAWSIRPNPGTGRFVLCCNDGAKAVVQLLVYDSSGRMVWQQQVQDAGEEHVIELYDTPSGIYFLEIRDGVRSVWLKVVVQR